MHVTCALPSNCSLESWYVTPAGAELRKHLHWKDSWEACPQRSSFKSTGGSVRILAESSCIYCCEKETLLTTLKTQGLPALQTINARAREPSKIHQGHVFESNEGCRCKCIACRICILDYLGYKYLLGLQALPWDKTMDLSLHSHLLACSRHEEGVERYSTGIDTSSLKLPLNHPFSHDYPAVQRPFRSHLHLSCSRQRTRRSEPSLGRMPNQPQKQKISKIRPQGMLGKEEQTTYEI